MIAQLICMENSAKEAEVACENPCFHRVCFTIDLEWFGFTYSNQFEKGKSAFSFQCIQNQANLQMNTEDA